MFDFFFTEKRKLRENITRKYYSANTLIFRHTFRVYIYILSAYFNDVNDLLSIVNNNINS